MHGLKPSDLTNPRATVNLATKVVLYIRNNPGTHSALGMERLLNVLTRDASMGHLGGYLDTGNRRLIRALLGNPNAMYLAARLFFENEGIDEALEKWSRTNTIPESVKSCSCWCTCDTGTD